MKKLLLLITISGLLFFGCRPEKKSPQWDTNVLAPIASASLGMQDMLVDSLIIQNPDNSLDLVYKYPLYTYDISQLMKVPDTSVIASVKLGTSKLANQSLVKDVSLGSICLNAGFTGLLIIGANHTTTTVPAFSAASSTQVDIDANTFFKSATFSHGFLDVTIENQLPISVSNLDFRLANKSNNVTVISDAFTNIAPNSSATKTVDLTGKTVEGNLIGEILSVSSPGSNGNPVLIDTSNVVRITLTVRDIETTDATAIFPTQNLIDFKDSVLYTIGKTKLKFMRIRSGKVKMVLYSTIHDTIHVNYGIPGATLSGVSVQLITDIPPAVGGVPSHVEKEYDLKDYNVDLTGRYGTNFSTFFNTMTARIDSSGKVVHISAQDSVWVKYGLYDIIPDYAEGYLGQDTLNVGPGGVAIDFFKRVVGGTLDLKDLKVNLKVENGVGADAQVKINELKSTSAKTSSAIALSGTAISSPFNITRATKNPLKFTDNILQLNSTNSNIKNLIESFPDNLNYNLNIYTNPNGNTSNYNDFLYYESAIRASLEMQMPLAFKSNNLTLADTLPFNVNSLPNGVNIKSGTMKFLVENGFPLTCNLTIYFLDENNNVVDSVLSGGVNTIPAGTIDVNLKVVDKGKVTLMALVKEEQMNRIRNARKMVIKTGISTPGTSHLKIYSDYKLDVKLIGDFIYHAKVN